MSGMFEGFRQEKITTGGAVINVRIGGSGPPLLLLHGFPQTHVTWHRVAPVLARHFTVVVADLRGYGDSSKPESGPDHAGYSKRAMALDQVEMMERLGHRRFALVGHDRGGRVSHRLALDHPDRVTRVTVLDIAPTRYMYAHTDRAFATAYYHWFFLIQRAPLPEAMIGANVELFLQHSGLTSPFISSEAYAEYRRCFGDPAAIHAACEDYRAAATIDLAHDEADLDRKIACPFMVLWGANGFIDHYDIVAAWRERAADVRGAKLPGGHYLPEQLPDETLAALLPFLQQ